MANDQGTNGASRTSNRGFASMDPQRQREIASQGGRAAHEKGTAHEFSSEEARAAGRKGGQARSENSRAGKSQASQGSSSQGDSASMSSER
jgi:general stress protein YciG